MILEDSSSDPDSHTARSVDRRALLKTAAAAAVGMAAAHALSHSGEAKSPAAPADATEVPGDPTSPYGQRSPFETATRLARGSRSLTPLQDLEGIMTPSALHFERHHNGVPRIDPARHTLLLHGMVERPTRYTMKDLVRFPSVSRQLFIECSGNSAGEWHRPAGKTVQDTHGLTSASEWTGVPLSVLAREVGVKSDTGWMLAEGGDAAVMTRSLPVREILNEALLCYAQNGEALRPEQGYPLRLMVPGWEGNVCIKWLRRLKFGSAPFMTREETSHYSDLLPDGTARQFTFTMEAKSVITNPSPGHRLVPGFVEVRGLAWSGRGRIVLVEISLDGGRTWQQAGLQEPVLPMCHTRFRFSWRWTGQETILQSRCTDETGYIQPARQALIAVRGLNSVYHNNAIQSWRLAADGSLTNVHA